MQKLLLLTLLFFSINAYAINWKKLHSDSKSDVYIFVKENQKKDENLYIKLMVNYLEPIYSKSTVLMKFKVDCKKKSIVFLRKSTYVEKSDEHFGKRSFNQGNLLSDKVENALFRKIC